MKFPCEIISEPYITQLRIEAANYLYNNNISQSQIASLMQISQPVVSGYLRKKKIPSGVPDAIIIKAREVGRNIGQILLQEGNAGIPEAISRGCIECKILRQSGPTCIFHRQVIPQLGDNCDVCLTPQNLIQLQVDKESVLRTLRSVVQRIIPKQHFHHLIPEIGMQIVIGVQNIDSISDIAAFPGRINKRKNNSPLYASPSFGGSETTSHLLMEIRRYNNKISAIATLKTSNWLTKRLEQTNINVEVVEGFDMDYSVALEHLTGIGDLPLVIVDTGSPGFEPISYLCSTTSEDLEMTLRQILK